MMRLGRAALAIVLTVGMPAGLDAQGKSTDVPSREKLVAAAREIMQAVPFCTLITIGPDGHPQARIVDAFAPDSAFVVWIGTNPLTRKVAEIRRDARVTLMYFNPQGLEYVTVIGHAVIDNDMQHKAAHWKASWKPLYKDEYRGADYVLVTVTPLRLEVVSVKRGIGNDPQTWRPYGVDLP